MMKQQLLLTALLALLNSLTVPAQIIFEKRYGINNDDHEFAGRGALAPDGGLTFCGSTEQDKAHHLFVQKTDSNGTELWYKLYTQLGSGNLFDIIAAAGGGYYAAGYVLNPADGSYDALLFHIDETGNLLWHKTYGAAAADVGLAVCQLNNGNLVLLGGAMQADNTPAHFRAVFDPAGNFLSAKSFTAASDVGEIRAVATSDGGYAAAVSSGNFSSSIRMHKYETGLNEQWSGPLAAYNHVTGSSISTLYDLKPTASGLLLCVQAGNGVHLLHIVSGGPQWSKRVHTGFPYSAGVQPYPDGTIGVAAHTYPFIFKKLAADGSTLDSVGTFNLPTASTYEARYIFQADQSIYLIGNTTSSLLRAYTLDRVTVSGPPAKSWSKTIGEQMPYEEETAGAIAAISDGGFAVAGTRQDSTGDEDLWVFRADEQGNVIWEKTMDLVGRGFFNNARIGSIQPDAAGNLIALAASNSSDPYYHLVKLSPGGDLIFDKIIDSAAYYPEFFRAYPLPDGGAIVCLSLDNDAPLVPRLIRTNANGDVIWAKTYAGNLLNDVIPLPDGNFLCAGAKTSKPWVFKVDATGNMLWEKVYTEVQAQYGGLFSMTMSTDGFLIATGGAWESSGTTIRALVLKADANDGNLIWQQQFSQGDMGFWFGSSILPAPSGGLCFMGTMLQPPANANLFSAIFRYRVSMSLLDADGNLVSEYVFGNDATHPFAGSAAVTADGHAIFCATTDAGASLQDAWVVKTAFQLVSAAEPVKTFDFSIWPNPAPGYAQLALNDPYSGPVQIRIFDAAGREVARLRSEKPAGDWSAELPLSGLNAGIYQVQLQSDEVFGVKSVLLLTN